MAETAKEVAVKPEKSSAPVPQLWRQLESLHREVERLFDDFDGGLWRKPFSTSLFALAPLRRAEAALSATSAVDVSETDRAYEITAELPGLEQDNIEVKVANGVLTIRSEKQEEKEEKNKNYYRRERSFGSFARSFQVPDDVDTKKIEANLKNGVLSVTLPKSPEAQKAEKQIAVKAG